MPGRKGLLAPQNTFLDTIATRFDGTRKLLYIQIPEKFTCCEKCKQKVSRINQRMLFMNQRMFTLKSESSSLMLLGSKKFQTFLPKGKKKPYSEIDT